MPERSAKQAIVSIPIFGYFVRVVSNIVRLPKIHEQFEKTQIENRRELTALQKKYSEDFIEQVDDLNGKITGLRLSQDSLKQRVNELGSSPQETSTTTKPQNNDSALFADDHIIDRFYTGFEDRFRGTEKIITERLEEYLPYFKNTKVNFKKTPVLDIGSGRGEFLTLMKKNHLDAVGLDINYDMVERSKKKGLTAIQGDALPYLQEAPLQSYGAITGFHIVEHIPFNLLLRVFDDAHRVLAEGGFVIFETPNPENIIVASSGFYTDPSHLNPIPPDLLAFALETCGFRKVEIIRLHPVEINQKEIEGLSEELRRRFYGPRDYAVVAYK